MKILVLPLFALLLFLSSCSMPMQYSGDTRSKPTTRIDIYYNHSEIRRPFKVLGSMTDHKYASDFNRKHFEKFARKAGGDAIIILNGSREAENNPNRVKAELIAYE